MCDENEKLRAELASVNRWGWVRELPRKAGLVFALMACLAIVFYAIWFCTLRGVAWGERARHNAKREALVHATRQYGLSPTSTVCDAEDTKGSGVLHCLVLMPNMPFPAVLECDDDDPVANDGCVSLTGPHGSASVFADAGVMTPLD